MPSSKKHSIRSHFGDHKNVVSIVKYSTEVHMHTKACLPQMRNAHRNDDTPTTSRKRPVSLPLNAKARQPTTSIGSISPPRILRSAPTPSFPSSKLYTVRFKVSMVEWQRKNEASIHRTAKHFLIKGGGGEITRENVASRV